jgi:hypothetical protein
MVAIVAIARRSVRSPGPYADRVPRPLRRPGRPRLVSTLAAVSAVLAVVLPGYGPTSGVATAPVPGPVVVLGTSGLHWDDLDPGLSNIATLVANGSVASMLAQQDGPRCPLDGWLALSALVRTQTINRTATDRACRPMPTVAVSADRHATINSWSTVIHDTVIRNAIPGQLHRVLTDHPAAAVGAGAVVAQAVDTTIGFGENEDYQTGNAWPGVPSDPVGGLDPAQSADELAQQVQQAVDTHPALLVVDLGGVDATVGSARTDQLVALDDRIGRLLSVLPESSTVLLASLADPSATSFDHPDPLAATHARSGVMVAVGPAAGGGRYQPGQSRAGWASTDGVAHSDDIGATVLAALGLAWPGGDREGSALVPGPGATEDPVIQRLDLDQAWRRLATVRPPLLTIGWGLWLLIALAAASGAWAGRRQRVVQRRFVNAGVVVAVFGAALPAAAVLAGLWPWWHGPHVTATLVVALLTGAVVIGGAALAAQLLPGPGRGRPTTAVLTLGLVTAAAAGIDHVTGNSLAVVGLLDHGGVLAAGLALVAVALVSADRPAWARRSAGIATQRGLVAGAVVLLGGLVWWQVAGGRMAALTWEHGTAGLWPSYPWLTLASTMLVLLPALFALTLRLADEAQQGS